MNTVNVGQELFNSILPKEYRDYNYNFRDKSTIPTLLTRMARELPADEYAKVLRDIFKLGADVTYYEGSSFSLDDLRVPERTESARQELQNEVYQILSDKNLSREDKNKKVISLVQDNIKTLQKIMMQDTTRNQSGLARQVESGARGKPGDLQSLLLGDMIMEDSKGNAIPIPLLHGYAQGVDPAEYFSNSFGTRLGVLSTKKATADAGYLSKRIKQVSHRQVVTENDCGTQRSIEVDTKDPDNIGALLAVDTEGYEAGTPIDANMLKKLKTQVLQVRSPITCDAQDGLCAHCAGIREKGQLPDIGENLGVIAGQSVGERSTQKALSAKHSAGRATGEKKDKFVSGYDLIEQLMSVPKHYPDAAAMSDLDGTVESIEEAAQGGYNVVINGQKHHVPSNMDVTVKVGDEVEAGDLLSEGLPDPAKLVKYRGLGEARRLFNEQLRTATNANRRNTEIVTKAFLDYIKIKDPDLFPNTAPDDIIKYSELAKKWTPREGTTKMDPSAAVGRYLETPVSQYTIGTRISRRVAKDLEKKGYNQIDANSEAPPFEPIVIPSSRALTNADDWQERMGGYYLKQSLLDSASRGMESKLHSTSYYPGIMKGTDFGTDVEETGKY